MGNRNVDFYAEGREAHQQIKLCFRKLLVLPWIEIRILLFYALRSWGGMFGWYPECTWKDKQGQYSSHESAIREVGLHLEEENLNKCLLTYNI